MKTNLKEIMIIGRYQIFTYMYIGYVSKTLKQYYYYSSQVRICMALNSLRSSGYRPKDCAPRLSIRCPGVVSKVPDFFL